MTAREKLEVCFVVLLWVVLAAIVLGSAFVL